MKIKKGQLNKVLNQLNQIYQMFDLDFETLKKIIKAIDQVKVEIAKYDDFKNKIIIKYSNKNEGDVFYLDPQYEPMYINLVGQLDKEEVEIAFEPLPFESLKSVSKTAFKDYLILS